MTDALERVIAPIVRGQINSYLHDHPEIAEAYIGKWRPKQDGIVRSLSKRIITDLVCAQTRVRLAEAVLGHVTETAPTERPWVSLLRSLRAEVGWFTASARPSPSSKGQTE